MENIFYEYSDSPDALKCTKNETKIMQGGQRCPEIHRGPVVLSGLYMLMANILLLNLLIALFRQVECLQSCA